MTQHGLHNFELSICFNMIKYLIIVPLETLFRFQYAQLFTLVLNMQVIDEINIMYICTNNFISITYIQVAQYIHVIVV